jgi:hypothetical protein
MTATLVGIAISLSWGNPVKVFAAVTASRTDFSARWPGTDQSTPARGEIAAASEPVNEAQTQNNEPPSGALLGQFQAWAAKEDARAQVEAVQQVEPVRPVQDARAQVLENAPAPAHPMQKHRKAKSAQNAQERTGVHRTPKHRTSLRKMARHHGSLEILGLRQ